MSDAVATEAAAPVAEQPERVPLAEAVQPVANETADRIITGLLTVVPILLLGVAVRGTALMLVTMLVPFTLVVLHHALQLHAAGSLPFCAIKFDCGCGAGEVFICRKLAENTVLTLASLFLVWRRDHRFALRASLFR